MPKTRKQLRKNTYRKRRGSLKRRSRRFFSRRSPMRKYKGGGVDPSLTGSYVADGAVVDYYEQGDDIPGPIQFRTKAIAEAEKVNEDL
jgi:hypothetical protein